MRIPLLLCAGALLLAAAQAQAQRPMYRCAGADGKVTYSEKICDAPKVLGEKAVKPDARKDTPPQDRARAANRAKLSPETLKECDALAATIKGEEAGLKKKGDLKPEDERTVTTSKKKYRELKCA